MTDTIALLATPAAIIAMVNLAKRAGLSGPMAAVVAVILGVALGVADWAFAAADWYQAAARGLLLGLSAAGVYDLARTVAPTPSAPTPGETA